MPANDCINLIARQLSLPYKQLEEEQCNNMIQTHIAGMFAESNPASDSNNDKKGKPLGLLAQLSTMRMTKRSSNSQLSEQSTLAVSKVPILNVYGQIEELYLRLSKEAYRIDTIGKGE